MEYTTMLLDVWLCCLLQFDSLVLKCSVCPYKLWKPVQTVEIWGQRSLHGFFRISNTDSKPKTDVSVKQCASIVGSNYYVQYKSLEFCFPKLRKLLHLKIKPIFR